MQEFPVETVKNSFKGEDYLFEDTIDCSGETESESDAEIQLKQNLVRTKAL